MFNLLAGFPALFAFEPLRWSVDLFDAAPANTKTALQIPDEPGTLTLALVGVVTVGAYLAIKRLLRPARDERGLPTVPRTTVTRGDEPVRGAA
jgi:hypothetical protein